MAPVTRSLTSSVYVLEQEIGGEDLLELAGSGTLEQLRECGLKTVSQQLKLRRILSACNVTSSSSDSDSSAHIQIPATGSEVQVPAQTPTGSSRTDRKMTVMELGQLNQGVRKLQCIVFIFCYRFFFYFS